MTPAQRLSPDLLRRKCPPDSLPFETTDELPDLDGFLGQERARHAVDLGVRMRHQGYNIFAFGAPGTGKLSLVRKQVEEQARRDAAPDDWVYVNNFEVSSKPHALRLPAGIGRMLRADMQRFTEELRTGLSGAFESEEVQARRQRLAEEFQERQQASLAELQEGAKAEGLSLLRTPSGLAFAPLRDGDVLPPEQFEKLPDEEQEQIKRSIDAFQHELQRVLYKVPAWERELRSRMRDLHQEVTVFVLNSVIDDLLERYKEYPGVLLWLDTVQKDVVEHVLQLVTDGEHGSSEGPSPLQGFLDGRGALRRYQVNLLVDAEGLQGAPVVYENNPTYLNLIGRVEHQAQMGALTTDFMLIKPGALHKANGGYLILDAQRVLMSPHSWEGLKRALQFGEIRIESPLDAMSLSTTITLEPEPIPLAVKVILMGEPNVYYLVSSFDPDFNELFKVSADFDDELHRSPEGELGFAHLIATLARKEGLRPFDSGAVASLIEHSSRMVDDGSRMSAHISEVLGLMQESNHWAGEASAERVSRLHVERAIESRVFRQNRMEEKLLDEVLRGSQLIDTAGEHVGQVNGLSVAQLGKYAFGHATRITATVRIGSGEVMDIEREVDLGGPIHSKGVMILSSLLGEKFAQSAPLSFEASLVFEQSYGGVEGDSASSTEFYALLSAIARLPIKQSIAVTGSVNQFGQVQAIGGVNAKIEGFFDLCVRRGLTGEQGVVIPASNLQHLMLKDDLLKAVEEGKFSVWTVETVDEGIELLTGVPAGDLLADGRYPEGSVYRRVVERLNEFTVARKKADDDADEDKPIIATRKRSPRRKVQPDSEPTTSDDEDSEPGVA